MLDQKIFGEKLRNHRKSLGLTQEDVAVRVGVSAQAISKWEAGDCLPDCFNLKAISDVYNISADVLLETESVGDVDAVANKIEQLCTEFIWSTANNDRYNSNLRFEMGEDLWKMWKGIYFAEVGNKQQQKESKQRGNLHITGAFGQKIWDDAGFACVVKSSMIENMGMYGKETVEVIEAISSAEGQQLIRLLHSDKPTPKSELVEKMNVDVSRLNELLLLFTENLVIEYIVPNGGYVISGHHGMAAYMVLAAMYVLNKGKYEVSQYVSE